MTSNPCQLLSRLLISVFACALNYRQVSGFVKATNRRRTNGFVWDVHVICYNHTLVWLLLSG